MSDWDEWMYETLTSMEAAVRLMPGTQEQFRAWRIAETGRTATPTVDQMVRQVELNSVAAVVSCHEFVNGLLTLTTGNGGR